MRKKRNSVVTIHTNQRNVNYSHLLPFSFPKVPSLCVASRLSRWVEAETEDRHSTVSVCKVTRDDSDAAHSIGSVYDCHRYTEASLVYSRMLAT